MISVIVPVYNVEKYLKRCIDSILNQTFKDIELILVDDGSTDNSGAICDEYAQMDKRIITIHKENGGVSTARNTGLDIAQGEYIMFVDSDDYIDEQMFEKLMKVDDTPDMIVAGIKAVYDNISRETRMKTGRFTGRQAFETYYLGENPSLFICGGKMYKKKFIQDNNFRFDTRLDLGEDEIFNMQCVAHCKEVVITKETYYFYRVGVETSLSTKFRSCVYDNRKIMLKYTKELADFLKCSDAIKNAINKKHVNTLINNVKWAVLTTEKEVCIKYMESLGEDIDIRNNIALFKNEKKRYYTGMLLLKKKCNVVYYSCKLLIILERIKSKIVKRSLASV